jgi:hypothetical protein
MQFSDLNLLVGISGVGKSQILESINTLKAITNGKSFNGVKWDIKFTTEDNLEYRWMGEFENQASRSQLNRQNTPENSYRILKEILVKNNTQIIIVRDNQNIHFNNHRLLKLSAFQSVIHILSEAEEIQPAKTGFGQIKDAAYISEQVLIRQNEFPNFGRVKTNFQEEFDQYSGLSLKMLQEANLAIHWLLIIIYQNFPQIFARIKHDFIQVFPFVKDVRIDFNQGVDFPSIQIQEKGVNIWINQDRISSGMLKILASISNLYLYPNGTVFLIDDLENSLGVNCIDTLSNLLFEYKGLQFIITSHHPYIINKIDMEYWKVITREGGIVTARDAKDFNLGKSKYEAFMQLINLDTYTSTLADLRG